MTMDSRRSSRRIFIEGMLAASGMAGAVVKPAAGGQATARPARNAVRLGGPIPSRSEDPEELAIAHAKLGYRAAYCPSVPLDDTARIRAIASAFAKHGVVIAEVGRWYNLLDARPEVRSKNLKLVTDGLALAEAIGALCCVDIAGSYNPTSWMGPHPDNITPKFLDEAVANARAIIDAVKPKRAKFCYEMMGWSLPDGPDSAIGLIKAVDREAFAVHLDPCNIINSPERFYRNADLLNDCFDKLGRWIVSCHAKDLTWDVEMNVHFRETIPGKGSLDYATYLRRLAELPQRPPLMMEHLKNAQEYDEARLHIMEVGRSNGITFG